MSLEILIGFFIIAIFHSLWAGFRAFQIHNISIDKSTTVDSKINQIIFNFLGALIGWVCLYLLITKLHSLFPDSLHILEWQDFALLLISYVGISCYLPYVTLMCRWPK